MSSEDNKPDHLYRSGVGIVVINRDKKIFVGKRIDNHSDAWQMPQGGLDAGEDEDTAMFRELVEETGIKDVRVISKSKKYFYYNLPYKLQKKFWGGKFLGQKQRWYLAEFLGDDSLVNINTSDPEFSEWKWISKEELVNVIVPFKKKLYVEIINEFKEFL
ncbi:MAG: pyrophosphohydrolase [Rickettsiaceae bacterium]|jgi:putative (di)nucleoside polyphosphate hydrolase|nr:pyrophosphohydrolase [Rickettsiaceae bacterium]